MISRMSMLLLLALALSVGGCASTSETASENSGDPGEEKVSTIPWNKPQKWEHHSLGTTGVGY